MSRTIIKDLLKNPESVGFGNLVTVKGWVRTKRGNNFVAFIALNDGSNVNNIQIVVDLNNFNEDFLKQITTGSSLEVTGTLVQSQGKGQTMEIQASNIQILSTADPET